MIISEITPQKKGNRFNLFIDGEFNCGISEDTLSKFYLYKGKDISEDDIKAIVKNELKSLLWNRVLTYTSKGLKTERDVQLYLKKLFNKYKTEFTIENIDELFSVYQIEIIEELKKYKYVDDVRYAQEFIDARVKNRPRSKRLIEYELLRKGIDKEKISQVMNESSIDENKLVRDLLQKKYKSDKITMEDRKKIQFLQGKGFDWDTIWDVMNN